MTETIPPYIGDDTWKYFTSKKNILITGGAGFIGHHVVEYLLKNTNFNIICLDRLDLSGNLNRLHEVLDDTSLYSRVKIVYHDLKSEFGSYVKNKIGEVDYILHLAAQTHVDRSIEFPLEFVYDNVVGTANLLEYARTLADLKLFVYFSTDEVFGPARPGIDYTEYARYNSTNPYSATKAGAEELVVAYHNTYALPAIVTHTMNVFGRRQHPEKFIPGTIRKILKDEVVLIHADKNKKIPGSRFYIHGDEVSSALLYLLNLKAESSLSEFTEDLYGTCKIQKFNIVGNQEINNLELAKLIEKSVGQQMRYELVDFHSSRPGHDLRYSLNGDKLSLYGWKSKYSFEEYIDSTVKWYLKHYDWLEL